MTTRVLNPRAGSLASVRERTWNPDEGHPRRGVVLFVLSAVVFMAQLDLFIVNIAIPSMAKSFSGVSLSDLSWVLNGYAIVFAALLVPAGRLADHFGRRRFLLVGIAVFSLASAMCAVAPSLPVLVAGRAIQAVGAALVAPASLGLLLPVYPKHRHNRVVGIWSGVTAVAALAGPPLGGLLVEASWRWIFLLNVPIGIAALLVGLTVLPEIRAPRGSRMPDAASAVSLLAAISLLILATVEAPDWGWGSAGVIVLLALSAVSAVVTVWRILRQRHPLIEPELFRRREFTTATIVMFVLFIGFAAWLLISVLFLQDAWHYSALRAGLGLAPGPVLAAVFALNSGRITARFGRTWPVLAGSLLIAFAAAYWLVGAGATPAYTTEFLPALLVAGSGAGLVQAPLFASANTLPPERATTGSAVLNMARQVGSAVGVAVLVTLGKPLSGSVAYYEKGWWLILVTSALGATILLVTRRRQLGGGRIARAGPAQMTDRSAATSRGTIAAGSGSTDAGADTGADAEPGSRAGAGAAAHASEPEGPVHDRTRKAT